MSKKFQIEKKPPQTNLAKLMEVESMFTDAKETAVLEWSAIISRMHSIDTKVKLFNVMLNCMNL